MGVAVYLQSARILSAVDAIYAVSGGSAFAFYTVAGQAPLGASIYYQDLQTRFIDLKRMVRGKPAVDISYLTHEVMWSRKTLDTNRILDSERLMHVYATDADTGKAVDLYPYTDRGGVHDAMYYSSRMPFWAGMPAKAVGRRLTDGAVATSGIACDEAINDGCTHVLLALTRPEGRRKGKSPLDLVVAQLLKVGGYPKLARTYLDSFEKYNQILDTIDKLSQKKDGLPQVAVIRPSYGIRKVASFETDPWRLYQGACTGYYAAKLLFKGYGLPVDEDVDLIRV